nr:uncharacterized protein LOC117228616 [Megalopta genalis]XP_033340348.1 uncharacterized protein LOC117228616 [Megalopta genalis]
MQLTSCCGCYTVKTGTIITGVLSIACSILSLYLIFTMDVEWKTILFENLDQNIVKIIYALNLCMTILISTLLIVGAVKQNTFMMLPWVALGIILAVGLLISVIYTAIMFFVNHVTETGILWLVIGSAASATFSYLWLVVYSYFQQLKYNKLNSRIGPYGKPYTYRRT